MNKCLMKENMCKLPRITVRMCNLQTPDPVLVLNTCTRTDVALLHNMNMTTLTCETNWVFPTSTS